MRVIIAVMLLLVSDLAIANVPRPSPGPVIRPIPRPIIHFPTPGPVVRPR